MSTSDQLRFAILYDIIKNYIRNFLEFIHIDGQWDAINIHLYYKNHVNLDIIIMDLYIIFSYIIVVFFLVILIQGGGGDAEDEASGLSIA